jgi:hypothetical protein
LQFTAELFTAQAQWGRNKKSRRGGMLDQLIFDRERV